MEGNYCVGQAIKGSDGSSSYECSKESISEAFRRKNIVHTLNLDLCHTGGEREEGPRVLHLQAEIYLGTHSHDSRV